MVHRIAVLTIATNTREIAEALRARHPSCEVVTYDLREIRHDRRRALWKGLRGYAGVGRETFGEAVRREVQKVGSKWPWASRFRSLLAPGVRLTAAATYAIMERFLADCDALVVWNGLRGPRFVAASIARARGLPTVFLERGFLPNTVQIDPEGVNVGSSVVRASVEDVRRIEMTPEREAWLAGLAFEQRPLGDMKHPTAKPVSGLEGIALPDRFVLFVAQVHDDTQIDFYSPHFSAVEDAIRYVHEEVRQHNVATGDTLGLVVKEHPQDYRRARYDTLRRELGDALFLQHVDNDELLRRSAAVVTINSSMGLQAIARNRPVVTLGEAVYNFPSVVYRAPENGPLWTLLPTVLAGEDLDQETQRKLLVYLGEAVLLDLPTYGATPEQYAGLADRIWQTVENQL